jgi:hypothetical protein
MSASHEKIEKPPSPEYAAFENLLGSVLSVSKVELDRRIKQEKREKRSPRVVSRVSAGRTKSA